MPNHQNKLPNETPGRYDRMVGALNSAVEAFCLRNEKTFDGLMSDMLQPIGEAMGVDRIFIDRIDEPDGEIRISRLYRWDSDNGLYAFKDPQLETMEALFPDWTDSLMHGHIICRNVSEISGDEKDFMEKHSIKSGVIIPVFAHGENWGSVVFEDHENETRFEDDHLGLIRSYALLCASAVMRNDLELEIVRQNEINKSIESDMHRLETESEKIYYDHLTGVYNRRFFDERLSRLISTLSRSGGKLSFLMFDIDNFKNYNDSFGHAAGDECLKAIADILSGSTARTDDFVARYGGDEFAVVLPNTDEGGARMIAEKILKKLNGHVMRLDKGGEEIKVTASIGLTTGKVRPRHRPDDYILRADELLYKSKQDGRNRYTYGDL